MMYIKRHPMWFLNLSISLLRYAYSDQEKFQGKERIAFFNDGLVFVTYDHYETFYEII